MSAIEIILEPGRADKNYWSDLWRYRELFQVLAWRDVAVRYKQTAIGVLWAVVRPFLTMIVFTLIFSRVAKLPTEGSAPYALMVLAGLLPWTFFSTALSDSSNSLISNANLIGKVYFPRLIVPTATIVVAFVDLFVSFGIFVAMTLWYRFLPGWQLLVLPLVVCFAFLTALGPGLWISALNVKYRDFRYVIPFIVQFGVFISPVGFSSSVIPPKWRPLYSLNPMVGVIDCFRWCLLRGQMSIDGVNLVVGMVVTLVVLAVGVRQFRKVEKRFADLL